MKVEVNVLDFAAEPHIQVPDEHIIAMMLRPGSVEIGLQRSEMRTVEYDVGEMALCSHHLGQWFGAANVEFLAIYISDAAMMAACNGTGGEIELRGATKLVDARVSALVAAVNAERIAGFPNGQLFLDSVESALAVAGQWLRGTAPAADVSRRAHSFAPAKSHRTGARQNRARLDS